MTIKEKVAFIKGLAEGYKLGNENPQDVIINKILDVLTDLGESVENLDKGVSALADYVDEIDADLGDLEEYVYDEDDDYDDDYEDDYEDALITCPYCKSSLELEEDDDLDNLVCPNCKSKFSIDEVVNNFEDAETEEDSEL